MKYHYDYAVIGGDLRQVYLTQILSQNGNRVCHYGLCDTKNTIPFTASAYAADSLEEALSKAPRIIAPIPLCKRKAFLNQNVFPEDVSLDSFLSLLSPGQLLFAGGIPEAFRQNALPAGIRIFDLMEDTPLYRFNTIATAEGAICEAISESPINLHSSFCAVLGYGSCATTLSYYLKGMFCHTFVAANDSDERAAAMLMADQTGSLDDFYDQLEEFDFIFNTIPATIITPEHLVKLKPTVTIIDIASFPGGLDHDKTKQLGIHSKLCPGLPGKYAALSSAEAVHRTIQKKLKENTVCL